MKNPLYLVCSSTIQGLMDVVSKDGGTLAEEIEGGFDRTVEPVVVANALAILGSTGHLQRMDDGTIYFTAQAYDPEEVQTQEEFMENNGLADDDGPTDEDLEDLEASPLAPKEKLNAG